MTDHTNQTVIVTGDASGIGAGVADLLAQRGAHVIVADRNATAAESQARRIGEAGGQATAIALECPIPAIARPCSILWPPGG